MVVTATFRVDVRPYSGYDDPSFPIAAWIAQGGVAGDPSGGAVFMDFLFQRSDDNQVSELFSLEQFSADTTGNLDDAGVVETLNMDSLAPNRPASTQKWQFRTEGLGATLAVSVTSLRSLGLPLWLGTPNRTEGNGGLRVLFTNVDLRLYAITLQGYMWGPRSVLAPGGPRRPVSGLLGNG